MNIPENVDQINQDQIVSKIISLNVTETSQHDFFNQCIQQSLEYVRDSTKTQNELTNDFFVELELMKHIRPPIVYQEIPSSNLRQIIVVGNIGSGKSTLCNKLYKYLIQNQEVLDVFLKGASTGSLTKKVQVQTVSRQNYRYNIVDSQGFGDPKQNQHVLWRKLMDQLQRSDIDVKVNSYGVGTFIVPIMMIESRRVEDQTITFLYQLLLTLDLIYPEFKGQKPQILIVIQGFNQNQIESDDITLLQYWSTLHEALTHRINKELFKNTFNFELGREINAWDSDDEEEEKKSEDMTHQIGQQIPGLGRRQRQPNNFEQGPYQRQRNERIDQFTIEQSQALIPLANIFTQPTAVYRDQQNMYEIERIIETIDAYSPLKMSNILSRPESQVAAPDFALFTPWQISQEQVITILKNIREVLKHMKKYTDEIIQKIDQQQEQNEHLQRSKEIAQKFKNDIEQIIQVFNQYMTGSNTFVLQKLTPNFFKYSHEFLSRLDASFFDELLNQNGNIVNDQSNEIEASQIMGPPEQNQIVEQLGSSLLDDSLHPNQENQQQQSSQPGNQRSWWSEQVQKVKNDSRPMMDKAKIEFDNLMRAMEMFNLTE